MANNRCFKIYEDQDHFYLSHFKCICITGDWGSRLITQITCNISLFQFQKQIKLNALWRMSTLWIFTHLTHFRNVIYSNVRYIQHFSLKKINHKLKFWMIHKGNNLSRDIFNSLWGLSFCHTYRRKSICIGVVVCVLDFELFIFRAALDLQNLAETKTNNQTKSEK